MNNFYLYTFYILTNLLLSIVTTYFIYLYFNFNKDNEKLILGESIKKHLTQYKNSIENYKIFLPLFLFSMLSLFKLQGFNGIFLLEFELFILVFILYFLAFIDLKTKEVPNFIILIMLFNKFIQLIYNLFMNMPLFMNMIITVFIVFIVLIIVHFISKGALGMGDVKLLSALSLYIGGYGIYSVLFSALIISLLVAIFLIAVKKKDRKYEIPFVPSIFCGYIVFLLFSI